LKGSTEGTEQQDVSVFFEEQQHGAKPAGTTDEPIRERQTVNAMTALTFNFLQLR
jgi:hypothetical protein